MRRPLRAVAVAAVAAAALGAAACGGGRTGAAATVNGEDIPTTVVAAITTSRVSPDPDPTVYEAVAGAQRETLSQLVQSKIVEQAADAEGVRVPKRRIDRDFERLATEYGGIEGLEEEIVRRGRTVEDVREQLASQARIELLTEHFADEAEITDADIEAEYRSRRESDFEFVTVSHIVVESRAEARDILGLLEGGADFAELARRQSTNPTSAAAGGKLGELKRSQVPPNMAEAVFAAEPGEVVGPFRSADGFHLILVEGFRTIELDEARDDLRDEIAGREANERLEEFVRGAFQEADVWVDPRFGSWDAEQGVVVAPEGAGPPQAPSGAPTAPPLPTDPASAPRG